MAIANVTMPQLGETVSEGTVGVWLKKEGDMVQMDEPLVEIITDKITTELPSPFAGKIVRILVNTDETVKIGVPIVEIESAVGEKVAAAPVAAAVSSTQSAPLATMAAMTQSPVQPQNGAIADRVSPLARRLAAEYAVDLAFVQGTGEGGRIRKEDILAFVQNRDQAQPVASAAGTVQTPQPASTMTGNAEDTVITPSPMRRAIAEHMVRSVATSPHASTSVEVDMTTIATWIERNKTAFKETHGYSITFMPFITRAVCESLREIPTMNAVWLSDGRLRLIRHINIGVAVATDNGLLVPVIKDADTKSVGQLANAIADLAARARANKLLPDEIQGSTFSITNPGVFGTVISTPIINQPNAGILSTDAVVKRPVVMSNDAIAIRSMMYLTLSFDHRINDGLDAAKFLVGIKRRLESYTIDIDVHV